MGIIVIAVIVALVLCLWFYELTVLVMGIIVIAVIVALVLCLWLLLRQPAHPVDQLPGPPILPFLGNLLMYLKNRKELFIVFNNTCDKYDTGLFRTWLTKFVPIIHITDPKHLETVMSSTDHIAKGKEYEFIAEWLGYGLLISKGAKWHSRRKLLTPAFHFSILEQFVPIFCDKTRILVEKLRSAATNNPEGIDIVPYVTRCALDIICQTAMGKNIHAQNEKDSEYVSTIYKIGDIITHRIFRPWLCLSWMFRLSPSGRKHDECLKILHSFTSKVIRERKQELNNAEQINSDTDIDNGFGLKKKVAFLDLLLHASKDDLSLTDEEIRAEVDTFMFEGHDTTAMGISWTLYYLSIHPEIQSRCIEELEEIFSGSDRDPNMADLGKMKYLERVIKETLRLRPSVSNIARILEGNLKLEGYEAFPANTIVHLYIYKVHRNPEIYPDPEKFDPDRFLPENCVGRHPYAYIPFSAGPRNCIGQRFAMLEMKEVVSTLLRHFRLESCDPEYYGVAFPDLILRPEHGLKTRIYPRNQ